MSAEQGSPEWFEERLGHATASKASDILAKIKTGEAATRRKYRIQLTTERLTKKPTVGFQNAAMQWGTEQEPFARMAYAAQTGADVEQVGFVKHGKMLWCGASPDGLVGVDGMIEIKCPESTTHLEWLEQNRVPPEHVAQIQFQLWVTGHSWKRTFSCS
jgi:putative phage-type endonuclease